MDGEADDMCMNMYVYTCMHLAFKELVSVYYMERVTLVSFQNYLLGTKTLYKMALTYLKLDYPS